MVLRGNQLHKMLLDHFRIRSVHGRFQVRIDHAHSCHFFSYIVIDQLGIILRTNAGKRLPLCLRDPEALEGVLDILRHILPVSGHLALRLYIGNDIVHLEAVDGRPPVYHFRLIEGFQ